MGLLDADAEELKKSNQDGGSGRKVNQSGLGAFKGLSKYSSLTSKYRTTGKESGAASPAGNVSDVPQTVEQSRGTIAKSVQSMAEVSAESVHDSNLTIPAEANAEVSANQVQSQSKGSAFTFFSVGINEDLELSAKSVQTRGDVSAPSENMSTEVDLNMFGSLSQKKAQQPTQHCDLDSFDSHISAIEVGAKSAQSLDDEKLGFETLSLTPLSESVPSKGKASAKSVQSQAKETALAKNDFKNEVSANRVHTQGIVSAKSVQSQASGGAFQVNVPQGFGEVRVPHGAKCIHRDLEANSPTESVVSLAGSQRTVLDFLFQLCVWNNSLMTPPITKQQLVHETRLPEQTAISSIKRLRNKFIIDRHSYKDGKAGWTQYKISEESYKELVHLQQMGNRAARLNSQWSTQGFPQSSGFSNFEAKIGDKPVAKLGETSDISLSQLSPPSLHQSWFKDLDFSKVRPIGPMLVNATIRNLVQDRLTAEIVQDFLNKFTSWMATQGKISSPLGLFCDKLKEFAREGDSPVLACLTEEERRAEAEYLGEVERAKLELARIDSARQEASALVLAHSQSAAFEDWLTTLPPGKSESLVPGSAIAPGGSELHKTLLRAYFIEQVWPALESTT